MTNSHQSYSAFIQGRIVVKYFLMNIFKKKPALVQSKARHLQHCSGLKQSKASTSLTNSKYVELFEHIALCTFEKSLDSLTAFFVNKISFTQGESTCAGSIGSTFCTFGFVPYRKKENVGFAYESMGLLRLKKTLNNHV